MKIDLDERKAVTFTYVNWQGVQARRRVIPIRWYYGSTEWHKEDQWLLFGWDLEKKDFRDYAMVGIGGDWRSLAAAEKEQAHGE